jgi:hypothetical protein
LFLYLAAWLRKHYLFLFSRYFSMY